MPKPEELAQLVFFVRGERVMLDADLARLYGVETRVLLQALKRNQERFPADFAFRLIQDELKAMRSQIVTSKAVGTSRQRALRSQIVISKQGRGGRRYAPYAFTEQ